MSLKKIDPRTIIVLLMIIITASVRVLFNFSYEISPIANFSPVGAMALFGGAYFTRQWKAFSFPLLTLFVSDFVLQQTVFKPYGNGGLLYGGWYWVYGAFALMTLAGRWLMKKISVSNFLLSTFVCVMIHWLVTDFGVWMGSKIYAQTLGGYVDCLVAAIPYESWFLMGTLVYGVILFGAFELIKKKYKILAANAE